jgi:hypothetical protein
MALFDNGDPPPLYVPDLTKPAGAQVDAAGNVACIQCQRSLPLAQADVVGQGYRCPQCSARAEVARLSGGASDIHANLSDSDRHGLRGAGAALMIPGALMVLGGIICFAALPGYKLGMYLLIGGGASLVAGLLKMQTAG